MKYRYLTKEEAQSIIDDFSKGYSLIQRAIATLDVTIRSKKEGKALHLFEQKLRSFQFVVENLLESKQGYPQGFAPPLYAELSKAVNAGFEIVLERRRQLEKAASENAAN